MRLLIVLSSLLCFLNVFANEDTYLNITTNKQQKLKLSSDINVIVFLSDTCPCTDSHLQHLNQLASTYKKYNFIGIHSNVITNLKTTSSYYKKSKVSFPVLSDKYFELANKFRAKKTPHIFILNDKKELLYSGGITNSILFKNAKKLYLKNALQDLNSNQPIKNKRTRTLGCAIDRSKI